MLRSIRLLAATVFASATLFTGVATTSAQPNQDQDGLVNVAIGDVTILENVRVALAAQVVAQICGTKVGPVVVLGRAVDRSGDTATACKAGGQDINIMQNDQGNGQA